MLAGIETVRLRKPGGHRHRDRDRPGSLAVRVADLQSMESDRHRLDALEIVERLGAGGAAIERLARRRAELGNPRGLLRAALGAGHALLPEQRPPSRLAV